jgi:TusA-related sulfurtransferase
MKTKEAMDAGEVELEVLVDEPAAWENIGKLAISQGWKWTCAAGEGEWTLSLCKNV